MGKSAASFNEGVILKKFFLEIRETAQSDKKDEFKQERTFGGMAKLPISSAFNELVGMDFVDFGGARRFSIHKVLFRAFLMLYLWWVEERGRNYGSGSRNGDFAAGERIWGAGDSFS